MGESCFFHSASVLITRGTVTFPIFLPSGPNWMMVTVPGLLSAASTVAGRRKDQSAATPAKPAAPARKARRVGAGVSAAGSEFCEFGFRGLEFMYFPFRRLSL